MDVLDTKPTKTCSKCNSEKYQEGFIKDRNICKDCRNERQRQLYGLLHTTIKKCVVCESLSDEVEFVKKRNICRLCDNKKRRERYRNNPVQREKIKRYVIQRKKYKRLYNKVMKELIIGINNKKCRYCNEIKPKEKFRYNRLKCRVCERDDPKSRFIRIIRSRIYNCVNKKMSTVEYIDTSYDNYIEWLKYCNPKYDNSEKGIWHIDHVIPLSEFDLDNSEDIKIAFNWRNTMPLLAKENLKKNNKIIPSQIKNHIENIISYHNKKNMEIPPDYTELFAKYLDAGNSLELHTTTPTLETEEEELG